MKNLKDLYPEFTDYVFSFYGKGGLYDMGATRQQIIRATYARLKSIEHARFTFDQDTVDREIVRDFLIKKFELVMP